MYDLKFYVAKQILFNYLSFLFKKNNYFVMQNNISWKVKI